MKMVNINRRLMKVAMGGGGGASRLNYGLGSAAHSFKMEPLARPVFVKMIALVRLISASKVP